MLLEKVFRNEVLIQGGYDGVLSIILEIMLPSKLLYFITLASIENYTKAANLLEISQPTLSHNIASLEDELGIKLFEKRGRSIMLTQAGKIFLEYAENSVKILEEGKDKLRQLDYELHGAISIGHVNVQSNAKLPCYMKGFMEMNPSINIKFDLHIDTTEDIMKGIKNDLYDVGFCFGSSKYPELELLPLWDEEFVIITALDHPLANRTNVTAEEILEYPHITYSEKSLVHSAVQTYYRAVKKHPKVVGTVEVTGAMIGLVSSGMGIGFAPISAVEDRTNISKLRITDLQTHSTVYLTYDSHKYQVPCVKRFIKYMEQNYHM